MPTQWEMQLRKREDGQWGTWVSISPSSNPVPYRYDSATEALRMLDMCYPDAVRGFCADSQVRILEVSA